MAGSSPLTRGKRRSLARFLDGRGLIPAHAGKTPGRMRALSSRWAHPRSRGENWLLVAVCVGVEGSSPLTRGKPGVCPSRATSSGLIPAHAGKTKRRMASREPRGAHPRSRGENVIPIATQIGQAGSSPLTRGKRWKGPEDLDKRRLIPAHAGKTYAISGLLPVVRAHPRSRGENRMIAGAGVLVLGSSPLTRGKPHLGAYLEVRLRLIPAHAGKTYAIVGLSPVMRAHPRSRGENRMIAGAGVLVLGSSPLTRGKPHLGAYLEVRLRLIPAHAGKTYAIVGLSPVMRAHPRSRGENFAAPVSTSRHLGSSPLTRGKPPRPDHRRDRGRLIPAHAGKTQIASMSGRSLGAHPRSRGENAAEETAVDIHLGSSPLTRGKRRGPQNGLLDPGLIPAHAGKTRSRSRSMKNPRAHPRSRGENFAPAFCRATKGGSSPLTRGKRASRRRWACRGRLIPAHAGKTRSSCIAT